MEISKDYLKPQKKTPNLHSPNHLLADELMRMLGDTKRFGFYLKTAMTHNHSFLHKMAAEVLEGRAKNPGALFAYLIKKHHQELKDRTNDTQDSKNS